MKRFLALVLGPALLLHGVYIAPVKVYAEASEEEEIAAEESGEQ